MSRVRAHQLMEGAATMLTIVNKSAITSESQARELAKVEPEKRQDVMELAVNAVAGVALHPFGRFRFPARKIEVHFRRESQLVPSPYAGLALRYGNGSGLRYVEVSDRLPLLALYSDVVSKRPFLRGGVVGNAPRSPALNRFEVFDWFQCSQQ